jgi:hypothetical protein
MATAYAQYTILLSSHVISVLLERGVWWYLGCENDGLYAEVTIRYGKIMFRVDGGDPYSSHCQYGLQYNELAEKEDVVKLESVNEIIGFRAVNYTESQQSTISVIFYRSDT